MSTVNVNIEDILGEAVACEVIFKALSTPRIDGTKLEISSQEILVIGSTGTGSITLKYGNYQVSFWGVSNNVDSLTITVPDDTSSHNLTALISDGTGGEVIPNSSYLLKSQNLDDIADAPTAFANIKQSSTTATTGVVRLATNLEALAGTATNCVMTPANVAAYASGIGVQPGQIPNLDEGGYLQLVWKNGKLQIQS